MPIWLHIIAVVAIVIYSSFSFFKQKKGFHILIIVWALSTLLNWTSIDPQILKLVGVAQIVVFIIVVFLMFRRRGERRMSTLELISKMAADSMPQETIAPPEQDEQAKPVTEPPSEETKTFE